MLCARRWRNVVVVALPLISFAFTGCDHFLASEGNPRPPAQQSQKKSPGTPSTSGSGSATNPSHPTSPTTPTSPSSSSPSPSAPTEDLTQKSLTLLSSTDVENSESGKPFTYDGRTLQLTFPDGLKISGAAQTDIDDSEHLYEARAEEGSWNTNKQAQDPVSCVVHYSLNDNPSSTDLVIAAGAVYVFSRDRSYIDNENIRHVVLQEESGGNEAGQIQSITCEAPVKDDLSLNVQDLVNSFGKDTQGNSAVDASIKSAAAPAQAAPSATSNTPAPSTPRPAAPVSPPHHPDAPATAPATIPATPASSVRSPASDSSDSAPTEMSDTVEEKNLEMIRRNALPNVGFQIEGSLKALGNSNVSPQLQGGSNSKAILIQGEYQPAFLQKIGVIGFGPSIGCYPASADVNAATSIWEAGAQVRYQFHYVPDQWFVPYLAYEFQSLHYATQSSGQGSFAISGGTAGLSLLLSQFEEESSRQLFEESDISRVYVLAELKNLQGSDDNIGISGTSIFFGLRFEL